MRKIKNLKPFPGRKNVKQTLVLRDEDTPSTSKPSIKKDGSIVLNDIGQLNELHSLDIIISKIKEILKQKKRSVIYKLLDEVGQKLASYAKELDEIGDGFAARKVRKLYKSIPDLIDIMDSGPKKFFAEIKKFLLEVSKCDPARRTSLDESISHNISNLDHYKNIKPRKVELGDERGIIIDAPVVFVIYRPMNDTDKVILEKQGVKFEKGVGLAVMQRAVFFAINKKKYRGDYNNVTSVAVAAISKNNNRFAPIFDVNKETHNAYCTLIVPEKLTRFFTNLVNASNKIIVHID